MTVETYWEGLAERECGDHRTTGGRAWCFDCSEWCSERILCRGCELPDLRDEVERLRAHLEQFRRYAHHAKSEHTREAAERWRRVLADAVLTAAEVADREAQP